MTATNEFKHTQGEWTKHPYGTEKPWSVVSGDTAFATANIVFGVGDKMIGEVQFQTNTHGGYQRVDSIAEFHANAALVLAAPKLLAAVLAVIDATSDYLPPDGISKDEFINLVLQATDTPELFAILQTLRGAAPVLAEAA